MKSRVKGDFQARFRENVGVKFPRVTRLAHILEKPSQIEKQINPHILFSNFIKRILSKSKRERIRNINF